MPDVDEDAVSTTNPFLMPDSIKDSLIMHGIDDEFKDSIDPVFDLAKALIEARSERDHYQKILESADGIDVLVDEQKIDRAQFPHWVVRVIAHALAGVFEIGKSAASFTVTDPAAGPIRVLIVKEKDE